MAPARVHARETAKPVVAASPSKPKPKPEAKPLAHEQAHRAQRELPKILLEGDEPGPIPLSGPGQRFALGTWQADRPAIEEPELPETYGTGKLLLTCRDPHCLYACWDFTDKEQRQFNSLSANHHLILRIYLNAPGEKPVAQIHLHPESRHWFVSVDEPGTTYVAELGYLLPNGQFHTLAVSAPVVTPRDRPSEETRVEFAEAQLDLSQPASVLQAVSGVQPGAAPSPVIPARIPSPLEPERPTKRNGETAAPGISPVQIAPPPGAARTESPISVGTTVAPDIPPGIPADWGPEQERILEQLILSSLVRKEWIGSDQIAELISAAVSLKPSPALGELPIAAPEISGPALAQPASVSSPSEAAPVGGRGFWFNVNAELVIYGSTEAGATVTIGGRPVGLQADGSFSFRFSLPDGNYFLPITAESRDGERREAQLKFARETHYQGEVEVHPQDPTLKPPSPGNLG